MAVKAYAILKKLNEYCLVLYPKYIHKKEPIKFTINPTIGNPSDIIDILVNVTVLHIHSNFFKITYRSWTI
jgi:hypothetical protein